MKNEDRVTATRAKLIDAAICSLAELGFHRTTFVEVSRRSELSRGAIHHHFDSIPDLMNAVVRDLGERIRSDVTDGISQLPTEDDVCDAGIDFLWQQVQSPNHLGLEQIRSAITTDQQLHETVSAEVASLTKWLQDQLVSTIEAAPCFSNLSASNLDSAIVSVVYAALAGAAAQDAAFGAPNDDPDRAEFCATLKRMANLATHTPVGAGETAALQAKPSTAIA